MTAPSWLRVAFEDAMAHAVHQSLLSLLVIDMASRGSAITNFEAKYGRENAKAFRGNPAPIADWAFDLGGGCFQTMPRETVVVAGLSIHVDCDHFETVLAEVGRARLRRFADGTPYLKLKFWTHATVLSPAQYMTLVDAMDVRLGPARRRAAAFYATRGKSVPS